LPVISRLAREFFGNEESIKAQMEKGAEQIGSLLLGKTV
jgi:hypothetical protein